MVPFNVQIFLNNINDIWWLKSIYILTVTDSLHKNFYTNLTSEGKTLGKKIFDTQASKQTILKASNFLLLGHKHCLNDTVLPSVHSFSNRCFISSSEEQKEKLCTLKYISVFPIHMTITHIYGLYHHFSVLLITVHQSSPSVQKM